MAKTRSKKLKMVQNTISNRKSIKLDSYFVKRAKGVTVKLERIRFDDFIRHTQAHYSIKLDRRHFSSDGRLKTIVLFKYQVLPASIFMHSFLHLFIGKTNRSQPTYDALLSSHWARRF